MIKINKNGSVINTAFVVLLLVVTTSLKIYSQAQEQRSPKNNKPDLCDSLISQQIDSPSIKSWANQCVPINTENSNSVLGAHSHICYNSKI